MPQKRALDGPEGGPRGVQEGSERGLGGVWAALGGQERFRDDFYRIFKFFYDFLRPSWAAKGGPIAAKID